MDYYDIWVDLVDSSRDLEFVENLEGFLGTLRDAGEIEGYVLARRKFGFSPPGFGEFHVRISAKDLAQLDRAFHHAATRALPIEPKHARVFEMVTNFKSALSRDFPDPVRER